MALWCLVLASLLVDGPGDVARGASGRRGAAATTVVETAPLRGLTGAPAVRAETVRWAGFGVGGGWATTRRASERADYTDRFESVDIEALWYPGVPALAGGTVAPFLAAGLRREEAWIGRHRERDQVTWARTSGEERLDTWVDHETFLDATQSVGVRVLLGPVTTSLRLVRSEVLTRDRRVEDADVRSRSYEPGANGESARGPVAAQLALHAGVAIR